MGVDEALLASAQDLGQATIRFYAWQGPWLSLGYTQRRSARELDACREAGVGCVRRTTGGRAVLHGADLTYAVAAPIDRMPPTLRASYSLVADTLLAAFAQLGVPAERSASDAIAPGQGVFDCFEAPAAEELCIEGRKFCGSAQRRARGALLQHGSIRLGPDSATALAAVTPSGELGGTSLAQEGFVVSQDALIDACVSAFAVAVGEPLCASALTAKERAHAAARGLEPAA
jgi:lipoate-protein ligase A